MDYLYRCVWKHKKSIREMLMEDSAAMSAGEMRYFDKRLWGKIPSWGYWKLYYGRLDGAVRDEIELTERELLKSGYVEEMEGIARSGEGDAAEARVFGYWQKLHKIADAESARIESRSVKREMRNAGFSAGVDRTYWHFVAHGRIADIFIIDVCSFSDDFFANIGHKCKVVFACCVCCVFIFFAEFDLWLSLHRLLIHGFTGTVPLLSLE